MGTPWWVGIGVALIVVLVGFSILYWSKHWKVKPQGYHLYPDIGPTEAYTAGCKMTGGTSGSQTYPPGTRVTITAIPAPGWKFDTWIGVDIADLKSATTTTIMNGDKTIRADFIKSP